MELKSAIRLFSFIFDAYHFRGNVYWTFLFLSPFFVVWMIPVDVFARGGGNEYRKFSPRSALMWEVEEWSVKNDSWDGNEYDLVATVTFTHAKTGTTRTTEMFYGGDHQWKFRFTGVRTGRWTFTTDSGDPDLAGFAGAVTVKLNPDPKVLGFLTHVGNKFAIMGRDETDLKPYVYQVYMNQQDYEQQYNHASRI